MTLLSLMLCASLACAQQPTARAAEPHVASVHDAFAQALARDPRTLPRAKEGRWLAWRPEDAIPEPLQAQFGESLGAYRERDYSRALAALLALLEREPDFPPALYQAGSTYFRLRRYGDCVVVLERFASVAPDEIGATQALGHSYYSLGEYERAREHYQKVLARSPDSVEALRGLALSNARLGEPERALELLRRVLELRPEHAEAQTWLAQVLLDLGRTEEALPAAERARDLDPYETRPWYLLGQILNELGRTEEADRARARFSELARASQEIQAMEGTLLHEPRRTDALARLVELHRSVGDRASVRETLARLFAIAPNELGSRVLALDALESVGDLEGAAGAASDLERLFPEEPEAWHRLQSYYASIGDRQRQVEAGERYLRMRAAKEGKR